VAVKDVRILLSLIGWMAACQYIDCLPLVPRSSRSVRACFFSSDALLGTIDRFPDVVMLAGLKPVTVPERYAAAMIHEPFEIPPHL
jgi:hypothetical protein